MTHEIFPMGVLSILGALEGKSPEEMAQKLIEEEREAENDSNENSPAI